MKRRFTFLAVMAMVLSTVFGQTNIVVDDFEGVDKAWKEGKYVGTDMTFELTDATHFETVDNPWADGVNGSNKVGKLTNYMETNVAFSIVLGNQIYFSKYPTISFLALFDADEANENNTIVAVLYNSTDGFNSSAIRKSFSLPTTDWTAFELDLSLFPSKPAYYDMVGFMFNPDWEDNDTEVHIDDITILAAEDENMKEVVLYETFGTTGYIEFDTLVGGFDVKTSGLLSNVKIECKKDYYWQEYLDLDGGQDSINADTRIQELRPDSTDANIKIFTPWIPYDPWPTVLQPYKDAESVACGIYPNSSLYFKEMDVSGVEQLTMGFAYMNHTWNLPGGNWDAAIRPTVLASVDGGEWTEITTISTMPPSSPQQYTIKASDGVTDSVVTWFSNAQWFYLEYPIATEGSTLDVAISNRAWSIHFYNADGVTPEYPGAPEWAKLLIDNVTIKGDMIETGLSSVTIDNTIDVFIINDEVTIDTPEDVILVKFYDLLGKEALSVTNSKVVDVSSIPGGVYILKVETADGELSSAKIIKQ